MGASLTGLRCYVSNTASTTSPTGGAGGVQLGGILIPGDGQTGFEAGNPITARYIYLSPNVGSAAGTFQISEVKPYVDVSVAIGTMQGVSVDISQPGIDLHAGTIVSRFPVDRGFTGASVKISPSFVALDPAMLKQVLVATSAAAATIGAGSTDLTATASSAPLPEMGLVLVTKDTNGKTQQMRFLRVYAPGAKIDFTTGQFAPGATDFHAITPKDGSSPIFFWDFED